MKQRGFTLIEILVVMAVGGIILAGIVLSVQQVFLGTARSNSRVVALTDIDRVVLSIKKDPAAPHFTIVFVTPLCMIQLR